MVHAILWSLGCVVCAGQGICTTDVANDCFVVSESDYMSHRDDIVYADKCSAIAIGDDGEVV